MRSPDSTAGKDALLKSVPIFLGIGDSGLDRLSRMARVLDITGPTEVFSQGDVADAVYAIVGGDGCVRIGAVDRQSKALMVEILQAGDIFGEIGVIEGKPRTASAMTEGRVRLVRISATDFRDVLAHDAALGEALCRVLARRLRRTFELFQDASFETLDVRLARQILYLAERGGRPDGSGLRLVRRVRQADLADLLGTTTRSIITILNAWRSSGLVTYDTKRALLTIADKTALEALVEQSDH